MTAYVLAFLNPWGLAPGTRREILLCLLSRTA